jgi:hypothetical protein
MAQDQQTITCPKDTWTQLTNADVTAITFEVLSGSVFLRFTTDATTPTEDHGLLYQRNQGQLQTPMSDLTYLSGAVRVWAKPVSSGGGIADQAAVYVDHG